MCGESQKTPDSLLRSNKWAKTRMCIIANLRSPGLRMSGMKKRRNSYEGAKWHNCHNSLLAYADDVNMLA